MTKWQRYTSAADLQRKQIMRELETRGIKVDANGTPLHELDYSSLIRLLTIAKLKES